MNKTAIQSLLYNDTTNVLLSLLVFSKRLLVVHNFKTCQDIIHEICEHDFVFEMVEGSPDPDEGGNLDVESKLFYRLD